jgi:hypothetical protein
LKESKDRVSKTAENASATLKNFLLFTGTVSYGKLSVDYFLEIN